MPEHDETETPAGVNFNEEFQGLTLLEVIDRLTSDPDFAAEFRSKADRACNARVGRLVWFDFMRYFAKDEEDLLRMADSDPRANTLWTGRDNEALLRVGDSAGCTPGSDG